MRARLWAVVSAAVLTAFCAGYYFGNSASREKALAYSPAAVYEQGLQSPAAPPAAPQGGEPQRAEPQSAEPQSGKPEDAPQDSGEAQVVFPLDLNRATAEQLTALPGIGEVLAERIVDYREENGDFTAVSQVCEVKGIGDGRLEAIREYIFIGGENTP